MGQVRSGGVCGLWGHVVVWVGGEGRLRVEAGGRIMCKSGGCVRNYV